jgi:hypothetical protein
MQQHVTQADHQILAEAHAKLHAAHVQLRDDHELLTKAHQELSERVKAMETHTHTAPPGKASLHKTGDH